MTTHQLTDWEDDLEITLFAISSHLEVYRLAYVFNKFLGAKLSCASPINFKFSDGNHMFNAYYSSHQQNLSSFYLIDNASINSTLTTNTTTLFGQNNYFQKMMLQSLKKWPYFVVSNENISDSNLKALQRLGHISYRQNINYESLNKSEQNILSSILYDQ